MILEIKINNYRFFENDTTLSFAADARTKRLLANALQLDGRLVNKSLAVYGANNSGKTNIISLFRTLKLILSGKDSFSLNRPMFGDNRSTAVEIVYNNLDGDGWFKYDFTFDNVVRKFTREKLTSITYYPNGSPFEKVIFEKDVNTKIFTVFGESHSKILEYLRFNVPLFYILELEHGAFASLKKYKDSFVRLSDSIEIVDMYNIPISKTIESMKNNDKNEKDFILSFVKNADLSIESFGYDKNGLDVDLFENERIKEKALEQHKSLVDSLCLRTKYANVSAPSLLFDSSGTKKIEAVASYIYEAIKRGKTLIVDELDNGLHYKLTRAIVSTFNNLSNTKGQLLFTAHDLLLIDCNNLMRKDQIYFLERTKDSARLFCLKEATVSAGGPREGADLIKRYNHGDFVEVPSPNFINLIIGMKKEEAKKNE